MRKIKTRKMNLTIMSLIIISIFFLLISVGYSYLQQQLNIYAKATVVTDESGKYINGNSLYSYEILEIQELENTNYKIYNVKLSVENMDNDINSWEIAFDAPSGFSDAYSSFEKILNKKYENGRLIIKTTESDGYLAKGSTIEIYMKLAANGNFDIKNLVLNGRLASKR